MTEAQLRLSRLLAKCYNDPCLFNDVILRRPPLHALQREWAKALVDYHVTAIETGNALGKDYFVGTIVPWWLYTRPNSLVVVTGPSQTLLGSVTWKEVRQAIENSPIFRAGLLPATISTGAKTSPQVVKVAGDWQALGFSTTSVERASGQHNRRTLVIVEESSGVEDQIWDALDGLKYYKMLAIGNPLRADCGFSRLCDQGVEHAKTGVPPNRAVKYINVPSTASPDAHLETSERGLADKGWLESMAAKYGRDSLWYRTHVLAIRPAVSHDSLIQAVHLDLCVSEATAQAVAELRRQGKGGRKRIGCDVGEGVGNAKTVIFVCDDLGVLEMNASAFTNADGAAQLIVRLAAKHGVLERDVSYDAGGSVGKKISRSLAALGLSRAVGYFGGGSGGGRAVNARTAVALDFANRIDPTVPGPDGKPQPPYSIPDGEHWPALREELLGLRYQLRGRKSALESKDDLMERLGRSPDYADALTQTRIREAIKG